MVATASLLEAGDPVCQLGNDEIDRTHHEFIVLVNSLATANKMEFSNTFQKLFDHTRIHFAHEMELMESSKFPAISEHHADHQRILGELERFNGKIKNGQLTFARAYITEKLPEWFRIHVSMMDSALVAHLNKE